MLCLVVALVISSASMVQAWQRRSWKSCSAQRLNSSEMAETQKIFSALRVHSHLLSVFEWLRSQKESCANLAFQKRRVDQLASLAKYIMTMVSQVAIWQAGLTTPSTFRGYHLMARWIFALFRSVSWLVACQEARFLVRAFLVFLVLLRLEDERACMVEMVLGVLAERDETPPAMPLHILEMQSEFSVMREPFWEVEDVEELLDELEKRRSGNAQLLMDLKVFLDNSPEMRVVSKGQRQEALRRLEAGEDLAELQPAVSFSSVPRFRTDELSFQRFFEEFALKRRPVIIEGLDVGFEPDVAWSEFRAMCGTMQLSSFKRTAECCDWASIEYFPTNLTLAHWMDEVAAGKAQDGRVLFEECLMSDAGDELCPALLQRLVIPKYFTMDLSKRAPWYPQDMRARDPFWGHPSIFVQPRGTNIFWHSDSLAANFWQVLLVGKKRWRMVPLADQRDRALWLCEQATLRFEMSEDMRVKPVPYGGIFPKNPEESCPTWAAAMRHGLFRVVEFETGPGDVLFVPSGIFHQTSNLEDSLALSMNYVDHSNFDAFVAASKLGGRSYSPYNFTGGLKLPPLLRSPQNLPWHLYARGTRPWETFLGRGDLLHPEATMCSATD